jgi:hypothetical protein
MFERNRIDNSLQYTAVPAEITLEDGQVLKGKFHITASRSIYEVLNGEAYFLDFERYGGERAMIARSALKSVKIVTVPQVPGLQSRLKDADGFDPHTVLGLEKAATFDEVRAAYHRLSKVYHPDRFAGVELPGEVRDYLTGMSRRINAAYAALGAPQQAVKRADIEKAKPIYITPQRF